VSRPLRLFAVGLVLLGSVVTGAYVASRRQHAVPLLSSRPAAVVPTAPVIPSERPGFSLRDPRGRAHSIAEWDGRPLLINFWATWCEPCRREIPLLERLRKEGRPAGLEIVGIAIDSPAAVEHFVAAAGMHYPVLVGEQDALDVVQAFGVATPVFPFTVFVDGRGEVLTLHLGELHEATARAVLDVLSRLEARELSVTEARAALAAAPVPPPAAGTAKAP
jgi:thiol-disulfide isomerase/thioredoxin